MRWFSIFLILALWGCAEEDRFLASHRTIAEKDRGESFTVLMARTAVRLVKPANAVRCTHLAHASMATLTLHRGRAVGSHGGSHRAAQAAGFGTRVALITGTAVEAAIER